ncbi:MAG: hypothetical protein GQ535_02775 [Rhodobacteraceae bacterium]|nr:hypothetical protein [Paracoccaceae bacterium]
MRRQTSGVSPYCCPQYMGIGQDCHANRRESQRLLTRCWPASRITVQP